MASLYAWDHSVDSRLKTIADVLGQDDKQDFRKTQVPGLKSLLDDYISDIDKSNDQKQVDYVDFHRRLLKVFKDSKDDTYQSLLQRYTNDESRRLDDFVEGADPQDVSAGFEMGPSLGCREEIDKLHHAETVVRISAGGIVNIKGLSDGEPPTPGGSWFHQQVHKLKDFFHPHHDEESVLVYKDAAFQNWGLNINNVPLLTCVPTTVKGVQRIVQYAAAHNLSVRCSGYRKCVETKTNLRYLLILTAERPFMVTNLR